MVAISKWFGIKDLALSRHVCTFFEAYWQEKFSNNVLPLRVGLDVATINEVMGVIEILSSRRETATSLATSISIDSPVSMLRTTIGVEDEEEDATILSI